MYNYLTKQTLPRFFALAISLLIGGCPVFAQTSQRYLSLGPLNLDSAPNYGQDLIEEAARSGYNAFHVTIQWHHIYPTATSQPDWRQIDNQIATCQKLGLRVALRISLCRNRDLLSGFWTPNETQKDDKGAEILGVHFNRMFSYAHQPTVEKAKNFVQEVHKRYENYLKQGVIIWTSVTTTTTQEIGYHYENYRADASTYGTAYDYSEPMKIEFRRWLTRKYSKVSRLNARWQTDFSSFNDVTPPIQLTDATSTFFDDAGKDWYVFRHQVLKNLIEQTTDVIKKVNPNYKVIADFGSTFDQLSGLRCSYAFIDLCKTVDGVKVNDGLDFDHYFSMDMIRTKAFAGRWAMNEVFLIGADPKEVERQIDENFAAGAHWINLVAVTVAQMQPAASQVRAMATKWLKTPYSEIQTKGRAQYNLSNILAYNYFGVYREWTQQAGPVGNRQAVDITLVEDLLADSLQGALNRVPTVKNLLPTKTIRLNSNFSYKISPEVFKDIDGTIARIELIYQPAWLRFTNGIFTGTPTQLGTYNMLLRAFDDDGAWAETNFTIVVNNVGRTNEAPVVKKKKPELIGLYKQPFVFSITDSLFADTDGFISRVEIKGLPTWAQFKNGEIIGIGSVIGEYPLTIKAFDDDEASVEISLILKINYPTITFGLIQAGPPASRRLIKSLANNETLNASTLPTMLNIYPDCNAFFTSFELELLGPNRKSSRSKRSPYGLYESDSGFVAMAGTYQLKGRAYFQTQLISSQTIQFKIADFDPITGKPITLPDWKAYPNPFDGNINIKLPNGLATNQLQFQLLTLTGQKIVVSPQTITFLDQTASIDLAVSSLNSGVYLLEVMDDGKLLKTLKIIKTK
jgi:Beta-galactosidase/Secretion system C-terminal sorting domain/Putative Ig domain